MRVLLSESASLTARETLTVLGRSGVDVDVLSSGPLTLGRFSRYRSRFLAAPPAGTDPRGYVRRVRELLASGRYDALLPTHEQAWLFAAAGLEGPVALAPAAAFARVSSKVEFARLLDELGLPQPRWWLPGAPASYAHWVKAAFGTAGRSVRRVADASELPRAVEELGGEVMCQEPAAGQYGQVQAVFDRGRLVAAHTCVAVGTGAGGSAAARLSVSHPLAVRHAETLAAHLGWHGPLTLDYFHVDGKPLFLECNPRPVEPGNAYAAGVNLPLVAARLSAGLPVGPVAAPHAGVCTRSALALALGAAERTGSRRAVLRALVPRSGEVLTPVLRDPPSVVPVAVVAAQLLLDPARAARLAGGAVSAYSVGPDAINAL